MEGTEMVTIDVAPLLTESDDQSDKSEESEQSDESHTTTYNGRLVVCLSNPKTIFAISLVFFTTYIVFIYEAGGFSQQFLHFGPGTNSDNTATFLGIVLDTWPKVIMMYVAGFLSSLMSTYYSMAMNNNLHSYIWNRAIKKVPFSRRWTYIIVLAEPFFFQVLNIISFFTSLTLQLQFILPQFIGSFIADTPYSIQRMSEKAFADD